MKRASSDHDGVCRCSEEPHNEAVGLVETADGSASGFARDFVADYAVNRAHEVADHIRPLRTGGREREIAAISGSQFLRKDERLGYFPAVH